MGTYQKERCGLPSFTIDPRITIIVDYNLALELADVILRAKSENPALIALAQKLKLVEGVEVGD